MATKAEEQNELRRAMKAKQRLGRGKKKTGEDKQDFKVARHLSGKFSPETEEVIKKRFHFKPEVPITTEFFRRTLDRGSVFVRVSEENAPAEEVEVTKSGIFPIIRNAEGVAERIGMPVFSVTVFTSGGFGVKFKSLKDNNRVIVL